MGTLSLCPVEPLLSFSLKYPHCLALSLLVIKGVDFCAFYSWPQTFLPPTSPSRVRLRAAFQKGELVSGSPALFQGLRTQASPTSAPPSLLPAHPLAGSALLS